MKTANRFSLAAVLVLFVATIPLSRAQGMGGMDMKDMDMSKCKGMMQGMDMSKCNDMMGKDKKGMEMKKGDKAKKSAEAKSHNGVGVVKSVDGDKGTVSIAHEPVTSMSWPAMTMTFKAKDKAMLEHVKPGAKVEFSFVQSGKDYIVTKIK